MSSPGVLTTLDSRIAELAAKYLPLASEMLRARRAEEKAKNRRPITEGEDKGALAEIMMETFGLIFVMEYDKALEQLMVGTPDEPAILAQAAESK